jgi:histidinol dehydrogenase
MRIINTTDFSAEEVSAILKKPFFDEVPLGEGARKKLREVFGAELTAAEAVTRIVADVKKRGDTAIRELTAKIDGVELAELKVSEQEFAAAYDKVEPAFLQAIRIAKKNVQRFHEEQQPKSWITYRDNGVILGQNCTPLARVGIYVPGGTANYPSSVLMNAIPAQVAGVKEIYMVVPPAKDGSVSSHVLVAAKEAGVTAVYKVGGAQAIAGLAFGTQSIPKVDKITGPGNIFVTLAKKQVYGYVDIDMLAGPSEILIIAAANANPRYIAADLLSQAEHDLLASAILITPSSQLAAAVAEEVSKQMALLPRCEIASGSLAQYGFIFVTRDMGEAVALANEYAPEHLEVMVDNPFSLLGEIKNAGAIFLGEYSPEPLGDYFAGPNHVLPTGGTARFYSVLNVETFMKKTSIISYSKEALQEVSEHIVTLAVTEGLEAHANAIRVRRQS